MPFRVGRPRTKHRSNGQRSQRTREAKGQLIIELIGPDKKEPLYREVFKSTSSRSFSNEQVNDKSVRDSMLQRIQRELIGLRLPYFLPKGDKLLALPAIME